MLLLEKKNNSFATEFLKKGYVICKVQDVKRLEKIAKLVSDRLLKTNKSKDISEIIKRFNFLHREIEKKELNKIRMKTIFSLSNNLKVKKDFFSLIDSYIYDLVGNELAMQKNMNLVVQMPKDTSSTIDLHADTWGGNSPFEIVVWLPLVDCYKTKSMFILDKNKTKKLKIEKLLKSKNSISAEQMFSKIKKHITWLNVKFGEVLLFQPSLPHGGRTNLEKETRVSINTRFKGLFTPYNDKKLGEYFEPISIKPCSRAGFGYLDEKII
jgi:sporadic carbohydrate cluster 2OG-Fe(II) oxygenase